ncbi:AraC family transcriptional regulator [Cupriavidus pinatubonensis]|uniref:AraC family transcriptional regulator n=1 Tax=Cupriavidus pinatubonensis TaxID=248026 RepID=UPI00361B373F
MPAKTSAITVPMRGALALIDAAMAQGIPLEALLDQAAIDPSLLDIPRARLSLKQFSRLYASIVGTLDDEAIGLLGYPLRSGSVETFCRVGATTTTLGDCVQVIARGCNAVMGDFKVDCVTGDGEIQIRFRERAGDPVRSALAYEIILLAIYAVLSWLVGQRLPLVCASFPCAPPRHRLDLRALLAGTARFHQPCGALHFPEHAGALHIVRNADEIPRLIRRAPASFIEAVLVGDLLAADVRRVVQQALPTLLSLPDLAERLAMSPRTLHRKLDASGTSFQKIKDGLRRDMALHFLTRGNTPLKQIATSLGFSDQSTFQRAFVQWTGVSPGEYRRLTQPQRQ